MVNKAYCNILKRSWSRDDVLFFKANAFRTGNFMEWPYRILEISRESQGNIYITVKYIYNMFLASYGLITTRKTGHMSNQGKHFPIYHAEVFTSLISILFYWFNIDHVQKSYTTYITMQVNFSLFHQRSVLSLYHEKIFAEYAFLPVFQYIRDFGRHPKIPAGITQMSQLPLLFSLAVEVPWRGLRGACSGMPKHRGKGGQHHAPQF